jgi:hypothetical protein
MLLGAATDVETQEPVGLARKADPPADSYFRGGIVVTRQPQGSHPAEIDAVQWFKRHDQDARSDADSLTRDVEHVRRAIGKMDIRIPP